MGECNRLNGHLPGSNKNNRSSKYKIKVRTDRVQRLLSFAKRKLSNLVYSSYIRKSGLIYGRWQLHRRLLYIHGCGEKHSRQTNNEDRGQTDRRHQSSLFLAAIYLAASFFDMWYRLRQHHNGRSVSNIMVGASTQTTAIILYINNRI